MLNNWKIKKKSQEIKKKPEISENINTMYQIYRRWWKNWEEVQRCINMLIKKDLKSIT